MATFSGGEEVVGVLDLNGFGGNVDYFIPNGQYLRVGFIGCNSKNVSIIAPVGNVVYSQNIPISSNPSFFIGLVLHSGMRIQLTGGNEYALEGLLFNNP